MTNYFYFVLATREISLGMLLCSRIGYPKPKRFWTHHHRIFHLMKNQFNLLAEQSITKIYFPWNQISFMNACNCSKPKCKMVIFLAIFILVFVHRFARNARHAHVLLWGFNSKYGLVPNACNHQRDDFGTGSVLSFIRIPWRASTQKCYRSDIRVRLFDSDLELWKT